MPTQEYLGKVVTRITLLGSLFLGFIAVSPYALATLFGDLGGLGVSLGGTGLLIAVSVVVETMKQLEAQMLMRNYEGFIK
jgi:preprotein translocase subunit SecY